MKKQYINISISVYEEYYDLVYALLDEFTFLGIEEKMDSLVVSFSEDAYSDDIKEKIQAKLSENIENAKIDKIETIEEQNWNEEWEKTVPAIHVSNKIGIAPTWKKDELTEEIKLLINPKMSFGTGTHSTTRLVCQLMDSEVQKDSRWIDAGTGTGVLAILAEKLGASYVYAFDNDHWSIDNAKENVAINNCNNIELVLSEIDSLQMPSVDGIAANINLHIIQEFLPEFYKALEASKGLLIVSGILVYHKDDVIKPALELGFEMEELKQDDEWVGIKFRVK